MDQKSNDPIFKEESRHLDNTVDMVSKTRGALEESLEKLSSFNIQKLKEMRENPITNAADYAQFMDMLKNKNVGFNVMDKYKRLEELEYLLREPYFSRIDLGDKVTKEVNKRYIGKFGFVDKNDNPVILDWRAKAATVFYKYRYPQENVEYETPEGIITKDLLLKRTFEIDDGELIKYFNNDIKLDESEIIIEKIEERTGGVLEDIVETIQKNQHEIITADPRRVTIVQGTVGSGKSTVAIHKLSYIFFNYPEIITPERSILIARNQILVGYLSTLFPKLGIFDINYGTIRDVVYNLIFKERIKVDFDLSKNKDLTEFTKANLNKILFKLDKTHDEYKSKIDKLFEKEKNEPFGGFVYDRSVSIEQNLLDIANDLAKEIKFQKEFVKDNPNHTRTDLFKENIKIMKKIVKTLKTWKREVKSKSLKKLIDEFGLYKHSEELGYKEALVYLIIYSELFGFDEYEKFEYCVVDEGQDFNILEYYVLDKLVQNGRFSILGDLNQSYRDSGLTKWEDIFEVVGGAKNSQKFMLKTNYRSTKPIVDLANNILKPFTDSYLPRSINRRGSEPRIVKNTTNNDVITEFKQELKNDLKNLEKSVGIICMDPEYYEISKNIIQQIDFDEEFIELSSNEKAAYLPRAVYLANFEDIKGLEFGKVYVLGLNLDKIDTFNKAKKAFVAVTRAMDELSIYDKQT